MYGPNNISLKQAVESVLKDYGVEYDLASLIWCASSRYGRQLLKQPVVNARREYMKKLGLRIYKKNDLIISRRDAVYEALSEIGDATSRATLVACASKHYGSLLPMMSIMQYRREYRVKMGLKTDCRTYKGQPRRDMRNDNRISGEQKNRFNGLSKSVLNTLLHLIGEDDTQFHSIKQLRNALKRFAKK